MDASTCALAFRTLRMNGYNVTSDSITKLLPDSFRGNMKDIDTTLELYKASELILYPDERDLEQQNLRLKDILEQEVSSGFIHSSQLGRNIGSEVYKLLLVEPYGFIQHRYISYVLPRLTMLSIIPSMQLWTGLLSGEI